MTDHPTTEVSRFGFTPEEFKALHKRYEVLLNERPRDTQSDGMVFRDWEAEQLRKVFEHFKVADPDVCAVLVHMMWYVNDRNYFTGHGR